MDSERQNAVTEAALRQIESEGQAYVRVQPEWTTSTLSYTTVFSPQEYYRSEPSVSSATLLRRRKKEEKEYVANFIANGVPAWIGAVLRQDGFLQVNSDYRLHDSRVMFLLNEQKLVYWPKRSKHLLPLLTELAEREGLALVESESIILKREGRMVAFWQFKHQKEVDDTELVMATKPKASPAMAQVATEDDEDDVDPLAYDIWHLVE